MNQFNLMKKTYVFVAIAFYTFLINGVELKPEKTIRLQGNNKSIISHISRFTINNNEEIIVPDAKMSNVKVFSSSGSLKYTLGRKGQGPGEFIMPYTCYSSEGGLWVSDIQGYKISKFTSESDGYKYKDFIRIFGLCTDIKVINNTLYIAGYIDGKSGAHALYSKDLKEPRNIEYLLRNEFKYGYTPDQSNQFQNDWKERKNFSSFDQSGFFEVFKNDIYFIWPGDLRIIKINIKDKSTRIIKHKTDNYIKPFVSKELIEAYKKRDSSTVRELRKNMSFVGGVFVTQKHIGLIYRGTFDSSLRGGPVYIQFFTHEGKFLEESKLQGAVGDVFFSKTFHYSEETSKLYYLNRKETQDDEDDYIYELLVFKI